MLYNRVIKPILYALPVERAHQLAVWMLRVVGLLPAGRWLLRKLYAYEEPSLERDVFGIKFKNPIGLAAGFDINGDIFREVSAMGFGFVEIGTITPKPQSGNPRPRVFRLNPDSATVNRNGLPNKGLEYALERIRGVHKDIVIGCNIGSNVDTMPDKAWADYLKVFRNLYQYADYFTVNINCDNVTLESVAPSTERLMQILEPLFDFRRGQNQYRPILLKISPDISNEEVDRMADIMIDTPLDGIVAVSGTNRRQGLATTFGSVAKVGSGRLGGKPLHSRALEVVSRIYQRAKGTYPIIGVGGIMTAEEAQQMLRAGASLVQLYSGLVYGGPSIAGDICRAMAPKAEPNAKESMPSVETPVAESQSESKKL